MAIAGNDAVLVGTGYGAGGRYDLRGVLGILGIL